MVYYLTACTQTLIKQDTGKAGFQGKVARGESKPPPQHGCHGTAVSLSSLGFLGKVCKALETSSCLRVRYEMIGLTLCHVSAPRENIIFNSGSKPAGECRLKNYYLEKILKHIRVSSRDNGILLSRFHPA